MKISVVIILAVVLSACAPSHDAADTYGACPLEVRQHFSEVLSRINEPSRALTEGIKADIESDHNCHLQLFY